MSTKSEIEELEDLRYRLAKAKKCILNDGEIIERLLGGLDALQSGIKQVIAWEIETGSRSPGAIKALKRLVEQEAGQC